jgi:hypothetical protein
MRSVKLGEEEGHLVTKSHLRARSALIYQRDGCNRRKVNRGASSAVPKAIPPLLARCEPLKMLRCRQIRVAHSTVSPKASRRQSLEPTSCAGRGPSDDFGAQVREVRDMMWPLLSEVTKVPVDRWSGAVYGRVTMSSMMAQQGRR